MIDGIYTIVTQIQGINPWICMPEIKGVNTVRQIFTTTSHFIEAYLNNFYMEVNNNNDDTCCLAKNFVLLKPTRRVADVYAYKKSLLSQLKKFHNNRCNRM